MLTATDPDTGAGTEIDGTEILGTPEIPPDACGAAIGAAAGFTAGTVEKLLGIESPQRKAHDDIKSIYGVDIPQNSGTIKQVVRTGKGEQDDSQPVISHRDGPRRGAGKHQPRKGENVGRKANSYEPAPHGRHPRVYRLAKFAVEHRPSWLMGRV